jgi:hypothetical protein
VKVALSTWQINPCLISQRALHKLEKSSQARAADLRRHSSATALRGGARGLLRRLVDRGFVTSLCDLAASVGVDGGVPRHELLLELLRERGFPPGGEWLCEMYAFPTRLGLLRLVHRANIV